MIDEDRTMQLFLYTSDELRKWERKPVVAVCEDCGMYRVINYDSYKDLCRRCSLTGENNPMYGKRGENNPNFGRCQTEEAKHKISIGNTDKVRTEEMKHHLSIIKLGDKNPRWRGGLTSRRTMIFNSSAYRNWRIAVFMHDEFTCQMCGSGSGNLQAHHIHPVRYHLNDLSLFFVDNGITLCKRCHKSRGSNEIGFVAEFEAIVGRRNDSH